MEKALHDRLTGWIPDGGLAYDSPLAGEFFGTMILILLGDGVVAAVLLKRSKPEGSGWIVITAGWASRDGGVLRPLRAEAVTRI